MLCPVPSSAMSTRMELSVPFLVVVVAAAASAAASLMRLARGAGFRRRMAL